MNPSECPTPGCTATDYYFSGEYDHLGRLSFCWCAAHGAELVGIRERKAALLSEIEGMDRVLCHVLHAHPSPPLPFKDCARCELERTVREQGILLVQLIRRERELTGAEKAKRDG